MGPAMASAHGAGNYGAKLNVDAFEHTSPGGSFPANHYGLDDMSGNVWQWCDEPLYGKGGPSARRGASWSSDSRVQLLSAHRLARSPGKYSDDLGFRCELTGGGASTAR